jgi:hypothetical protein
MVPPDAWPRFISEQRTNNNLRLTFATSLSNNYNLERATNLATAPWQLLQTNFMGTGETLITTVTNPFTIFQSYYRLRIIP